MVTADTAFISGKVATVDRDFSFREAIAVRNGRIIDVGTNKEINGYIGADTHVIDLKGRVILPAAHDAHVHGFTNGLTSMLCDCSPGKIKNISGLKALLEKEAGKTKPGAWIRGRNINPGAMEECKQNPGWELTRKDLDAVTADNPVIITFWSMHGLIANSKALEICGINRETPDPGSGVMVRDSNGHPTGVFLEFEAMGMVSRHVPPNTTADLKKSIMIFQEKMNREGYAGYTESTVSVEPGTDGPVVLDIYKELYETGVLTNRVTIGIITAAKGVGSYANMLYALDNYQLPSYPDPNWLKAPLMKIFCDGVHVNYTAWMLDDYADRPGFRGNSSIHGDTEEEQEAELYKMIGLAHQRGYQVGVHAIGDRAVKTTIEGFIKAMQEYPRRNPRHYVIHADTLGTNEMARRAAKYGVVFSVQPGMADTRYEQTIARVGPAGKRAFGLKEFLDIGVVCAGGSDVIHGELCNWRQAVQSAMTRRSRITGEVYSPELALSLEEGIRLFTNNGAYQENCEGDRGSIEIGKVADFQILEEDIFETDPEEIGKIRVEMTMVDGNVVYDKEGC